ncbi:MAG: sodium:proton antiporter [Chloroflexi bacterium]|nr:sodium:proton antiporter [Chloroflexota bacterium]MCI0576341.1 sodium:proton antiporter [Chloroflexota bacterium]MCI0643734.1 sodium:proton antiporter [Chloroflexota bacterium]MCI0725889.1 sodium:proton antiporter [Chloroflexota bacterium]
MFVINYVAAILLFLIGLYGLIRQRNAVRMILNLGLMESATYLFLVAVGYRAGATAPIFYEADIIPGETPAVDPIVQALTLTSIVIGVVTLALALALVIQLARHYRTLDAGQMRELRG